VLEGTLPEDSSATAKLEWKRLEDIALGYMFLTMYDRGTA